MTNERLSAATLDAIEQMLCDPDFDIYDRTEDLIEPVAALLAEVRELMVERDAAFKRIGELLEMAAKYERSHKNER